MPVPQQWGFLNLGASSQIGWNQGATITWLESGDIHYTEHFCKHPPRVSDEHISICKALLCCNPYIIYTFFFFLSKYYPQILTVQNSLQEVIKNKTYNEPSSGVSGPQSRYDLYHLNNHRVSDPNTWRGKKEPEFSRQNPSPIFLFGSALNHTDYLFSLLPDWII